MFRFDPDIAVYLHVKAIDFRKGINALVVLVEEAMQCDPFAHAIYGFRNQRANRIKLLGFDRTGFWLLIKRLEQDRFIWPSQTTGAAELTSTQLHWLLEGIDLNAMRFHPTRV